MEYFRIFGCKTYLRESRGDIRKDWSDRSKVGVLIGYSETPLGWWVIYIPEMGSCVTSVHVRFNEDIPDYKIEYFQELKNEMLMEKCNVAVCTAYILMCTVCMNSYMYY